MPCIDVDGVLVNWEGSDPPSPEDVEYLRELFAAIRAGGLGGVPSGEGVTAMSERYACCRHCGPNDVNGCSTGHAKPCSTCTGWQDGMQVVDE